MSDKEPDSDEVLKITITEIIGNTATVNIRLRGHKNWIYIDRLKVHKGRDVVIADGQEKASKYITRQVERQQPTEWGKRMKLDE